MKTASEWFSRLRSGRDSPEDRTAFEAWLSEKPAHRWDYNCLKFIWARTAFLKDHPVVAACLGEDTSSGDAGVADRRSAGPITGLPRPRLLAAAAGLVLVAAGVLLLQLAFGDTNTYRTMTGEQTVIALDDGSVVHLNTATALQVNYSETVRHVDLRAGQALFSVARDPARPFVVAAGQTIVRAVGTEFDVYNNDGQVTVTVVEGSVEVSRVVDGEDSAADWKTTLYPGYKITVDKTKVASLAKPVDVDRVVSWRRGKLDLDDTPLAEAVAEINRYSTTRIRIADDRLGDILVSGVFNVREGDKFVRGLEKYFPIRIVSGPEGGLVLKERSPSGPTDG